MRLAQYLKPLSQNQQTLLTIADAINTEGDLQVVVTDKLPVLLHYVPHLDQVWVLNWRSEHDVGVKTIQVIRDAAQKRKHHTVHPEPIDGQFDLVRGLYMPPVQVDNFYF